MQILHLLRQHYTNNTDSAIHKSISSSAASVQWVVLFHCPRENPVIYKKIAADRDYSHSFPNFVGHKFRAYSPKKIWEPLETITCEGKIILWMNIVLYIIQYPLHCHEWPAFSSSSQHHHSISRFSVQLNYKTYCIRMCNQSGAKTGLSRGHKPTQNLPKGPPKMSGQMLAFQGIAWLTPIL